MLGLALLLAGLSILGWAAWQYFGTNVLSERAASQTRQELTQRWQQAAPSASPSSKPSKGATPKPSASTTAGGDSIATVPGEAVALIRIPALGPDWEWPVLVGTDDDTLARGIGWYSETDQPGQIGNFALAGHRVTHGEPFRRLLELKVGDQVIVETQRSVFTYQLDTAPAELTVADTAGWVLDAVPGKPSQKPSRAVITLTTCQDLFHSADRSVAFGHLVSKTDK